MRTQTQAKPAPAGSLEPLSAEDREILATLELLEALDLLESLGTDEAPPLSEIEEGEAK